MPHNRGIFFYLTSMYYFSWPWFILSLGISLGIWAQDAEQNSFYREDQLYVGLNYLVNQSNSENFQQEGLSSQFQLGVIRDFPIHSSGRWAVGLGLGYERNSLRNNIQWNVDATEVIYSYDEAQQIFKFQSLSFPIEIRWRSSTLDRYAFWRVYTGLKWHRNWTSNELYQSLIQTWSPTTYISLGYNTWNLQVAYALTPLYKKTAMLTTDSLRLLSLGLIFYIF